MRSTGRRFDADEARERGECGRCTLLHAECARKDDELTTLRAQFEQLKKVAKASGKQELLYLQEELEKSRGKLEQRELEIRAEAKAEKSKAVRAVRMKAAALKTQLEEERAASAKHQEAAAKEASAAEQLRQRLVNQDEENVGLAMEQGDLEERVAAAEARAAAAEAALAMEKATVSSLRALWAESAAGAE